MDLIVQITPKLADAAVPRAIALFGDGAIDDNSALAGASSALQLGEQLDRTGRDLLRCRLPMERGATRAGHAQHSGGIQPSGWGGLPGLLIGSVVTPSFSSVRTTKARAAI